MKFIKLLLIISNINPEIMKKVLLIFEKLN